jgi:hypothetical protein
MEPFAQGSLGARSGQVAVPHVAPAPGGGREVRWGMDSFSPGPSLVWCSMEPHVPPPQMAGGRQRTIRRRQRGYVQHWESSSMSSL